MKKCLYCSLLENGDIPDNSKDILYRKRLVYGCYSLRIGINDDDFGILIQDVNSGHIILDKNLKFKYCPMCGRDLKDTRRKA